MSATQHAQPTSPGPAPSAGTSRRTTVDSCRLRCWCGTLHGVVTQPANAQRVICYCRDCQAYAHFLGQPKRILDRRGGSDVLLTLPANVTFTSSLATLACLRLTPKGLLRWYAKCCSAPIGNTLASHHLSFVGLVRACLDAGSSSLDEIFGPVTLWNNTAGAWGSPRPAQVGRGRMTGWLVRTMVSARFNGSYRRTPFFNLYTGAPIAIPRVLTPAEHARVRTIVQQA